MTQPRITTTAQLLAAIPALLGYVPADSGSFVVIALETDPAGTAVVKLVTRTTSEDAAQASTTSTLSGALANNGITAVIVVTIAAPGLRSHAVIEHMLALRELSRTTEVIGSYYLPTLAEATTGENLDTGDLVHVDPYASEVAADHIADGKPIERRRDAIAARYQQGEHIPAAENADPAQVLEELAAVIYADELPDRDLIARTAAVITTIPVRDAMFRLALYGRISAWTAMATIARHSHGDARIQVLCLAGWLAHTIGNGPDAGSAYEAAHAHAAETGHSTPRLLDLLDTALNSGLDPKIARDLTAGLSADEVRASTGAHLPGAPDRN
ncbi:DUF4192 family protein [Rhodococcus sp. MEB064]|uniref:DUF4192 family protein n=1 Tax=Rhodococcus sp. MEB064 TaxID=1587522 RepID=UPI0005AC7E0E|nr:DUF4192 family protein [Rhodococcus sp. MEB064]KIQ16348.1 hypothetical protein RU01_13735 [Rhodococcus sp. MEB064]